MSPSSRSSDSNSGNSASLDATPSTFQSIQSALGRIRALYAQFLGIGPKRRAILPELVRLLLLPQPPPLS